MRVCSYFEINAMGPGVICNYVSRFKRFLKSVDVRTHIGTYEPPWLYALVVQYEKIINIVTQQYKQKELRKEVFVGRKRGVGVPSYV